MTKSNSTTMRGRPLALALALALLAGGANGARAGDPPPPVPGPGPAPAPQPPLPPLPQGVVARVKGKDVTRADFQKYLAQRLRSEAAEAQSAPATVLEILIKEVLLGQEASRLGIVISQADLDARYRDLDLQLKLKSNGTNTLAELMKQQNQDPVEFMTNLRDLITEERIAAHPSYLGSKLPRDDNARLAQIQVVVGQIYNRAKIERTDLPSGLVGRVNGVPVTDEDFGRALEMRLAASRVRDLLREQCATILLEDLMATEGLRFTDADLEAAIATERTRWNRLRAQEIQPEMQSLSYEDYTQWRRGRPIEVLKKDKYFRGWMALMARFRSRVTDNDIRAEYVRSAASTYGASVVVTDIQAIFKVPNALMESVKRRSRDEAMRIVKDYARRLQSGEPAEKVIREIEGLKDPSLTAKVKRVRDDGNGQPLFHAVDGLKDGAWSPLTETLSEWHLLRRDRFTPAPSFEEVKDDVREVLVQGKALSWVDDQLRDQNVVRMESR